MVWNRSELLLNDSELVRFIRHTFGENIGVYTDQTEKERKYFGIVRNKNGVSAIKDQRYVTILPFPVMIGKVLNTDALCSK